MEDELGEFSDMSAAERKAYLKELQDEDKQYTEERIQKLLDEYIDNNNYEGVEDYGISIFWLSYFWEHGVWVDFWGDVVEGAYSQERDFVEAYLWALREKGLILPSVRTLATGGIFGRERPLLFTQHKSTTVATLITKQGNDLYISWRAFFQPRKNFMHIWLLFWAGLLVLLFRVGFWFFENAFTGDLSFTFGGLWDLDILTSFVPVALIINAVLLWLVLMLVVAGLGLLRHKNPLAYFRDPVDILHADGVVYLTSAVHQSIMDASDKVGIDSSKLVLKEPYFYNYRPHRRPMF